MHKMREMDILINKEMDTQSVNRTQYFNLQK